MIGVLATPISEELKNVRQPDKRKDIQGKLQRSYMYFKAISVDISIYLYTFSMQNNFITQVAKLVYM